MPWGARPAMASSNSAASATVRASGPSVEKERNDTLGAVLTTPRVGLIPTSPQTAAGLRTDPAPSLPWPTGMRPGGAAGAPPAAGAAGVTSGVVRYDCGSAYDGRVGVAGNPEFRRVGRAEGDCPRSSNEPDRCRIAVGRDRRDRRGSVRG